MVNPFGAREISAGYAMHRPPIHPYIVRLAVEWAGFQVPVERALDIGCGAGLSTRALRGMATERIGLEPAETMLGQAAIVGPGCSFAVAQAEAIPIRDGSIDLITAAGSLNYVHLDRFFPEARRVLAEHGALLVYDFSAARSFQDGSELDEWFSEFERRYPWPPNEARELSPEILRAFDSGFELRGERFEIGLRLTSAFYVKYMMTETNVALAVRHGTSPEEVETWLRESLASVWSGIDREVIFRGYFAWMT